MTRRALLGNEQERRPLFPIMQGDPGSSDSFDKKRKAAEESSSVVDTSVGKRIKWNKSPSEADGERRWPDYFKEVSVREAVSS